LFKLVSKWKIAGDESSQSKKAEIAFEIQLLFELAFYICFQRQVYVLYQVELKFKIKLTH